MSLALVSEPDPRLRQPAAEVVVFDKTLKRIAKDMQAVMLTGNGTHRGAGLAGPQVGVPLRIICVEVGGATVMVNPVFEPDRETDQTIGRATYETIEGCLSCATQQYKVVRWVSGTVRYQTVDGAERVQKVSGARAQVIQHEIDHLNGITLERRAEEGTAEKVGTRG